MLSEQDWLMMADEWLDEFISIKEKNNCGDIHREIEECFTDWLKSEKNLILDDAEEEKITEMALFWYEETT